MHQGTDSGRADHPLSDGRHSDEHSRPGRRHAKGGHEEPVNGFYAVGECSCVSVHGANRLGTNSLLDLVVFGRAAGNHIVKHVEEIKEHKPLPADAADFALSRLAKLDSSSSGEYTQSIANDIRATMQAHAGVFRTSELLAEGVEQDQRIGRARRHTSI